MSNTASDWTVNKEGRMDIRTKKRRSDDETLPAQRIIEKNYASDSCTHLFQLKWVDLVLLLHTYLVCTSSDWPEAINFNRLFILFSFPVSLLSVILWFNGMNVYYRIVEYMQIEIYVFVENDFASVDLNWSLASTLFTDNGEWDDVWISCVRLIAKAIFPFELIHFVCLKMLCDCLEQANDMPEKRAYVYDVFTLLRWTLNT